MQGEEALRVALLNFFQHFRRLSRMAEVNVCHFFQGVNFAKLYAVVVFYMHVSHVQEIYRSKYSLGCR